MTELLADLGLVVTSIFGYVVTAATTIVDTPYFLLVTGILFAGAAVALVGRFLSKS